MNCRDCPKCGAKWIDGVLYWSTGQKGDPAVLANLVCDLPQVQRRGGCINETAGDPKRTPGPNAGGFQKCSLASWETTRTQSRFLEGFTTDTRYPEGMDEPSWLDMELPLHLELEQECAVRRLPEIEDFDDLEELTKTAIEHNFRLVWICKQCIDRVNELEQSIDELLEEGAT